MKIFLFVLLSIHGLVHLLGFAKALYPARINSLRQPISRPAGALWLIVALLFICSALLFALQNDVWWIVCIAALVCSQGLIVRSWTDAKFGTIANALILVPLIFTVLNTLPSSYQNRYRAEVNRRIIQLTDMSSIKEEDLAGIPPPVQNYLRRAGVVGREKVAIFRAVFHGTMQRTLSGSWMRVSGEQHNFFGDRARLFYIKGSLYGLPFEGLHSYTGDSATMLIKAASLVQVGDARGKEMTRGETVTMFNDMCFLAPATLIDTTIHWKMVDSLTVDATFTNRDNTISARLFFDKNGLLINFRSNDRYLSEDGSSYSNVPWSTPITSYREIGGRRLPASAEAVWHMPDGDIPYAKYTFDEIEYNCTAATPDG